MQYRLVRHINFPHEPEFVTMKKMAYGGFEVAVEG